ncbi:gliding motility-associated C-terminal domain-containing protein [Maribacter sedimenticola]|uniref:Gliding motility-associated C-terminal domain-containing protein n=2 Tax=Maribacter sedimenticola TaxID=228956 RepID=A0ABY1SC15_9FLAO|nr:gliding motility-associated C-terminal domain-containing protein [Maribacter sedimenticola]
MLISSYSLQAQQEAAIWYFGRNAGLDFRSGTPVPLVDGQIYTREGCATISDNVGNLLFYTDGISIWDRNHNTMPNGTGLLGDPSSSQSGMIVPHPGDPNLFYVFVIDNEYGADGLTYNVVDMSLNGGLGDVTSEKNVLLWTPISERITAVEHANGQSIWVITRADDTNQFLAYLIDDTGINTVPVVSNMPVLGSPYYAFVGQLKASQDGSMLASAYAQDGKLELYRFDTATGSVYDPLSLEGTFDDTNDRAHAYGVEFSASGNLLYVSTRSGVYQYDVSSYDRNTIMASRTTLTQDYLGPDYYYTDFPGAIQMGIDGKIYVARLGRPFLMVVNDPEVLGVGCNMVEEGVYLGAGTTSMLGLPPFITSFFYVGIEAQNFCLGQGTEFSVETSGPITSITWDFGDGNTSTDEEPVHVYAASGTFTVNVTANTATDTKTETKDITIYETPVANTPADLIGCTSYGSYNLDMPSLDTTVLGAQDPNDFSVAYFLSQADADGNVNALETIHSFEYGTTPVFVRVSNRSNIQCYDTTQFNIIAREAPLVDTITDWTVCNDDTDGLFTFDLSQKTTEIFNGQDETKFEILYFASQADADAGTNPLPTNYTNTAATETIYVRFQNSTYTDCFRTGSFVIEVIPGVTANQPTDLSFCDDNNDGQAIFDLTQTETEIIGTQNPNSLNLTYHETQTDADSGVNPLSAGSYLSTTYQNTIYVRVENALDTSCYASTFFNLNIYDTPVVPQVADWQVCDDNNDGIYFFDFSKKETEILSGSTGTNISFYVSQTDAETAQNGITGNYQNISNPQTIYFRLENSNNAQCYSVSSFQLQVFDTPRAYTASDIIICDTDETGRYYFDLSEKDAEVLNGQDPLYYDVSYHGSENDALNNIAPLSTANYQNTNLNEILWARIQHTDLESCFDVSSYNLIVNPLPQMNIEERYVICPDSPDLILDGGDFETWSWQSSEGVELSTNRNFNVSVLGTYQLIVRKTTNGVRCENSRSFEVLSSGAPETMEVEVNGFSDQIDITVTATGTGPFEYSVDGENYQASNKFVVFPGKHTVFVRDLLECRVISEEIIAIGYQRFFTPNGDGKNEHWNIIGAELYPASQLFIYDRYGKFIVQVSPNSKGWDGSYNGNPLPASDYWFKYVYSDNQRITGHFALKR